MRRAETAHDGAASSLIAGLAQINFRVPRNLAIGGNVIPRPLAVEWTVDGVKSRAIGLWVEE
ncbi:MAG: hypothetical protein H6509_05475 [Bryobacterales bacterium]|nr:hypothetical protein [Acidobacteriota bacterium]MCB9384043.1 hypothetical protein [Bryobacterales bacterium]